MRRISSTGQANEVVSSCHSGATLVRPGLEALRDLAAQGCLDVVLCYSPDRLARKFAYQALLIEEFARAGVRVEFVRGPRGDTPEDSLTACRPHLSRSGFRTRCQPAGSRRGVARKRDERQHRN